MKIQGFTLVELLAVIVILAVLALIATPVVLSIIDDTKESAMLRSAEMYLSGVENAVMRENMNSGGNFRPNKCTITSEGNLDCEEKDGIIEVEVNGEKPKNGVIEFENGKIKEVRLEYETATIVRNEEGNLIFSDEKSDSQKEETLAPGLYKQDGTFVSWEQLTSMEYHTIPSNNCCIEEQAILTVDENGVLTSAVDYVGCCIMDNLSSEYLNGKLVISDSVTSIHNGTFYNCSGLTSVIVPNSVISIGYGAFDACENLISATIGDFVTSTGVRVFQNCISLTSVTIGNSVTSIGAGAFYGCTSLTSITIPNSVTSIDDNAFYGCTSLTSVIISDSVTSISDDTFKGCSSLTSITIPDFVESIGRDAFNGCSQLKSVTIGNSVTSISSGAFEGCISLTSIYIPSSVITMYANYNFDTPFCNCSSELKIYCGAKSKPSGWGTYWDYYDSSNKLSVTWDVTRDQYNELIMQ